MKRLLALSLTLLCSSGVLATSNASQSPTRKETRELLTSVCSSGVKTGICRPCPAFARATRGEGFLFESVIYGKFTSAKYIDAILDFSGCDAGFGYGGSVVLRWQGLTRWKFMYYLEGYRTERSFKYPARDGRDLLLRQVDYEVKGALTTGLVFSDFNKNASMTQSLFYLLNSSEACSKTGSLQQLLEWNQVDLNGDRNPDLQAIVKSGVYLRRGATPKAPCDGQLFTGPSRNYTLEYTFDGAQFMPTKATREMITELLKDNPNFLGPID